MDVSDDRDHDDEAKKTAKPVEPGSCTMTNAETILASYLGHLNGPQPCVLPDQSSEFPLHFLLNLILLTSPDTASGLHNHLYSS